MPLSFLARSGLVALLAAGTLGDPAALRSRIRQTLFVPNALPAPDGEIRGNFSPEPGIVADRVTYATEFGMRVPAIVYHPSGRTTRRPALIVVNGHGGDKYSWYSVYAGILFARAGAVVLTYDPAGEGERNSQHKSGTRRHDRYVAPDDNARRLAGLMIADVMQAVSYLRGRPDVDPARIAAAGYSMGSFVLSLACAVDTRLRACVLAGGGDLDGPGGYWDSSNKKMCQGIPYQSLAFLGDRPAVLFALHALRGPTLIHNGSSDEVVEIPSHGESFFRDLRARTAQLLGSGNNLFEYGFTPDGGHRPYFLTRPVATWLHRQLRFPNWNAIAGQETHISRWAQANHVPMDRMYADEHREGGTIALGAGLPFPDRSQLNVLPEAEWTSRKNDFILEAWYDRIRELNP
jgi:dienelactone hydrolase